MRIALELQPCCGSKSGIGVYAYEISKHMHEEEDIKLQGNLFNFLGHNNNELCLKGVHFEICENRFLPYGIYRRLWDQLPIKYGQMFPVADVSLFFNFIAPPRITGQVVTVIHDMTYLRYPETVDKKNLIRLRKNIDYSIERSTRIVTVSEFSKREISELCTIPMDRIDVVYPAASIYGGIGEFDLLANRFKLKKPYILFVGSIEPRKNLYRLLSAYDKFREKTRLEHQLVICGGEGWNNKNIYEQLYRMQYHNDVIMTGYLSDIERNTLYKNSAVMIFPSIYEGFGVPPLEAMYWGAPVICANAASLPEVVGDSAHYIDPMSVDSIADGLEYVLTDKEYASSLVERGQTQWRKFNWEESATKMLEICKQTVL